MALSQFKTLVKMQTDNGVRLIDGEHDHRSAKVYISCIADAVAEKCAVILGSKHFMSVLSDGSQARKTKSDKEMVMVRFERNGLPCYIVASLLEMEDFGGTGAESLYNGINGIFAVNGTLPLDDYRTKLVSCTADGASVNFGRISGLLTRLDNDRGWLIKIHCANHRVELSVKDAFEQSTFTSILDPLYTSIYTLLKNSGKLKSEVKSACEALNIKHYVLPKLTGTRFIGHRVTSFTSLLNVWPALVEMLGNVIADPKTKSSVRAKATGILNKLKSYAVLCNVCSYLDLLEAVLPISKIFEGEGLMIYEVPSAVHESMDCLDEIQKFGSMDDDLVTHMRRFVLEKDGDETKLIVNYKPHPDVSKTTGRKSTNVDMSYVTYANDLSRESSFTAKKKMA